MDSSGSWGSLKAAYAQLAGITALPAVGPAVVKFTGWWKNILCCEGECLKAVQSGAVWRDGAPAVGAHCCHWRVLCIIRW